MTKLVGKCIIKVFNIFIKRRRAALKWDRSKRETGSSCLMPFKAVDLILIETEAFINEKWEKKKSEQPRERVHWERSRESPIKTNEKGKLNSREKKEKHIKNIQIHTKEIIKFRSIFIWFDFIKFQMRIRC